MIFCSHLDEIPHFAGGSVVAMGDFDGLHPGHQALITEAVRSAAAAALQAVLVTYEPSPKKIMKKLTHDSRLTTLDEKRRLLAKTGLDVVVFYPVSAATLRLSARSFLRDFLLARLSMRRLVMGGDHHFGHNRRGNARYLTAACERYGFALTVIDEQLTDGKRTSSSFLRQALGEGDTLAVQKILGRPYSVDGKVIAGERRGAALGFPTANLALNPEKLLPLTGVYAGSVELENGQLYAAVANLGYKPTAGGFPLGLEIHLLGFEGDLYGQTVRFDFGRRIRGEQKFASFDALKAQIARDIAEAAKSVQPRDRQAF